MALKTTLYSDPGCPWAYSENPAHAVLRWRYDDQLDWRFCAVGLAETNERYLKNGYTPARQARGWQTFRRRYGQPFGSVPRERVVATSLACRTIVATRLAHPGREWAVFRALQFAQFTTTLLFDEIEDVRIAIADVPGIDVEGVLGAVESPEVWEAYDADRAETRTAAGSPTEFQGKHGNSDGAVRYTAPSVVFETDDGRRLEAGGFQPVEAYDVLIANLDPTLKRRQPPSEVGELLAAFPDGLTTQEVAAVRAWGNEPPDRLETERALISLVAHGNAERMPLGDDALWRAASS
jgi:protein-disulfide isomerase-like protein with CxxC motif